MFVIMFIDIFISFLLIVKKRVPTRRRYGNIGFGIHLRVWNYPSPVLPKTPTLTSSTTAPLLVSGSKVTLTCATSSHGSVSYKFLLNGKDIPHTSGNTYTVPSTATANSNSYTCKATISGAESVPSAEVKVKFVGEWADFYCNFWKCS